MPTGSWLGQPPVPRSGSNEIFIRKSHRWHVRIYIHLERQNFVSFVIDERVVSNGHDEIRGAFRHRWTYLERVVVVLQFQREHPGFPDVLVLHSGRILLAEIDHGPRFRILVYRRDVTVRKKKKETNANCITRLYIEMCLIWNVPRNCLLNVRENVQISCIRCRRDVSRSVVPWFHDFHPVWKRRSWKLR